MVRIVGKRTLKTKKDMFEVSTRCKIVEKDDHDFTLSCDLPLHLTKKIITMILNKED